MHLLQCTLPHAVINRGIYAPAMLVTGTFGREAITIGAMLHQQQPTLINRFNVQLGTLQFYPENSEMCYRAWPEGTWLAFAISRERMLESWSELFDAIPELPYRGIVDIKPSSKELGAHLLARLQDLDRSLRPLSAEQNATRLGESVERDLLARLGNIICRSSVRGSSEVRRRHRCGEMIRDAIKLVERDPDEMLDMQSMSKATGLSPRTLQRTFQTEFGLCPQEWFRVERLNRVRQDLLHGLNSDSITRTAVRWGFFHLGRFAYYYRQLFGEGPRETLRSRRAVTAPDSLFTVAES
jgi:AraC-like DNA-binding protein